MENFMKRLRKSRQLTLLAAIMLVLVVCTVAIAEEAAKTTGAAEAAEKEKVSMSVEQKMRMRISVDFRETPIDDVIRAIAKQADLDVVKGPTVTGNVTATLTDVPLEEALSHILAAHNYGYVTSENMIRVVPASELAEATEKLVSKVYRIVYADVAGVEKVLSKIISKRGSISANPGTSNIMVTDTESKMTTIDSFIAEMDRRTAQILVEARIYDITDVDALDLGIEWSVGARTAYGVRNTTTGANLTTGRTDPFVTGDFDTGIAQASTTATLKFGFLNDSLDIFARITAAERRDAAKLLASPRILVLDNETASFKAVTEIPYQQLQQGGFQSFGTTEFKEVGVELQVTPHLAKDGMIRLHIMPVFSVHVGNVDVTMVDVGGTARIAPQPKVDRREADTLALVRDGQTVVIGGLRKQNITKESSKVPVLGDVPLFGALFRFDGEKITTSELVVFITPTVIEEPVLTETEAEYLEETDIRVPEYPPTNIDALREVD
jgi:type IV pilus assembly protein PilQ